jgi:hypothetical protein
LNGLREPGTPQHTRLASKSPHARVNQGGDFRLHPCLAPVSLEHGIRRQPILEGLNIRLYPLIGLLTLEYTVAGHARAKRLERQ